MCIYVHTCLWGRGIRGYTFVYIYKCGLAAYETMKLYICIHEYMCMYVHTCVWGIGSGVYIFVHIYVCCESICFDYPTHYCCSYCCSITVAATVMLRRFKHSQFAIDWNKQKSHESLFVCIHIQRYIHISYEIVNISKNHVLRMTWTSGNIRNPTSANNHELDESYEVTRSYYCTN